MDWSGGSIKSRCRCQRSKKRPAYQDTESEALAGIGSGLGIGPRIEISQACARPLPSIRASVWAEYKLSNWMIPRGKIQRSYSGLGPVKMADTVSDCGCGGYTANGSTRGHRLDATCVPDIDGDWTPADIMLVSSFSLLWIQDGSKLGWWPAIQYGWNPAWPFDWPQPYSGLVLRT
ncbi:hypothetical protein B0H14DRAFT_2593509 [Mycena olivaceomarginata]|nr:hypothetical protein B0H14DRAFT_2593509 [Mycena olivaceomarginata]